MSEAGTQGNVAYDASAAITFTGQAERALVNAKDTTVDSVDMFQIAADDLMAVKALARKVEDTRTSITAPLNQVVKVVNDLFRAPAEYLENAERVLKAGMLAYSAEQQRIADQARLAALQVAGAERQRLAAIERENQAKAQAAREQAAIEQRAAHEAAMGGDQVAADAALQRAQEQVDRSHAADAEANAAAQVAAVTTMAPAITGPAKVRGVSTSSSVDFEVNNLLALVQHVAANPELITLLAADSVKLRAYVRGLGLNCRLPGVRVFSKTTLAARSS